FLRPRSRRESNSRSSVNESFASLWMRMRGEDKTMAQVAGPTAALAGVPAGLQAQGVWSGRRQIFVRFAAEAETATMYTADALVNELRRSVSRSSYHSISISGRDPLSNVDYLQAAFSKAA